MKQIEINIEDVPVEQIAHLALNLLKKIDKECSELIPAVLVDFCNNDVYLVRNLCDDLLRNVGVDGGLHGVFKYMD